MIRRDEQLEPRVGREPSRSGFESAVRPQRLLLSGIAGVLVAFASGRGHVVLGSDLRAIIVLIACANAAWNGVHLMRRSEKRTSPRVDIAQTIVDALLALSAAVVADTQSSPLVWILLLVPVIDAAVRFGAPGAVMGWLGVSSAYVFLLSVLGTQGDADQNVVGNGLQQIAAVAAIAIPMLGIVSRLRSELDDGARSRVLADAKESHLRGITHAAREFSEVQSPHEALQLVVDTAIRIGFDRADVCICTGEAGWQLALGTGHPAAVNPRLDGLLVRSAVGAALASVGVSEPGATEIQELHDLGYHAAVVAVMQVSANEWLGLRAYSVSSVAEGSPMLESVETLVSLCSSSWVTARTRESLEGQRRQAEYESKHDSLTRIPNRSSAEENLKASLLDRTSKTAVMFIDLNGFKAINDRMGHAAGDTTLLGVAARLRSLSSGQVFVARLGGDEFILVVRGYERDELERLAMDAIAKVAEPIEIDGQIVQVGASIGVAEHDGEDDAALLNRADELMYLAKQESRTTNSSIYRFSTDLASSQRA